MKICILGNGFAALTAAQRVRKRLPQAVIELIAPSNEFIYYPSLIWIPCGLRKGDDLRVNLTNFFAKHDINYIQGRVTNITDGGRTVVTDNGSYSNDGLIIGTGGRFIKKLPGLENAIIPCAGIAAAEKIKHALETMESGTLAFGFGGNPKEPSAMRGGPIFEFILGTHEMLIKQGRRDKFKIIFFSPAPEPGKRLGRDVPKRLLEKMRDKGIDVHIGRKMLGFGENQVQMEGLDFAADLIMFMPGMTGPDWLPQSELPKSEGGLIKANKYCQVEGLENTYVAGDSGSFPGPEWQAKQAHAADLQAVAAANNLANKLQANSAQETFKHELICIIDSNKHGIMVKRTEKGGYSTPPLRLMHLAKRYFEWHYLRQYRL
ncbi:MAG: NAD(P)/FAD-dependent oxidoreductase [Gammaproteobacteria bacterium]|nr:NAD(P)/FAD-dependent oxidoreductase [Gammaproteobacteria bacterium]NNJ73512.1 NAD(P)/FAD-dependent oxidoreductase [Enterobacterales bacterium]